MHPDIALETLPAPIQRVLAKEAPGPVKLMAARGIVPGAKPGDIVTVVSVLAGSDDPKLAEVARATLSKLPPPILQGALTADLPGSVIAELARAYANDHEVVTALLRMPRIGLEALEAMATAADERAGELIATNEELMLKHPTVIEKLYMNKRVRMSTADRLVELAVRHGLELDLPAFAEAAQAIKNELILEAAEEPYFDDVLFKEAHQLGEALKLDEKNPDTHEVDEEGEEKPKEEVLPLHAKLAQMTVSQKIRAATLGSAGERLILVRDPNRLVSTAAVKSPLMRENEAAQISASRAVSEDVLRQIALNREFTRSYQVRINLVTNPRTPLTFATRFVPHLRDSDLRILSRSKNISAAIAQLVKQQMSRKEK
ncbi:MAG TPA: hypothetical protein VHM25_01830 [Polyangiaceae bacterium]|jgi:hypothetical protein|nr:hypothetical protein [Polyangiaceae bacterium]